MRILISGGCGFIGSNLAIYLRQQEPSFEICALDNLKRRGSELNIARLKEAGVQFIHGDMRCTEDLDAAGPADIFIDASAEPSVLAGIDSGHRQLINNNLLSTINALDWCIKHKAKMIFLSTSRVYPIQSLEKANFREEDSRFVWEDEQSIPGISSEGVTEDFPMNGVRSLYGATKYASELLIQEYGEFLGLDYIINRCGVVSGPWQMGKIDQGVLVLWIARHFYQKELKYIGYGGQGKQVRDILHIKDLCSLLLLQIKEWDPGNRNLFNVGGGLSGSASLLELTRMCEEVTGNKIQIKSDTNPRPADLRIYLSDHSKLSSTFNWQPQLSVRELVEDTFAWISDNDRILRPILNA